MGIVIFAFENSKTGGGVLPEKFDLPDSVEMSLFTRMSHFKNRFPGKSLGNRRSWIELMKNEYRMVGRGGLQGRGFPESLRGERGRSVFSSRP